MIHFVACHFLPVPVFVVGVVSVAEYAMVDSWDGGGLDPENHKKPEAATVAEKLNDDPALRVKMSTVCSTPVILIAFCMVAYLVVEGCGSLAGGYGSGAYIRFTIALPKQSGWKCLVHSMILAGTVSIIIALRVSGSQHANANVGFRAALAFWGARALLDQLARDQSWLHDERFTAFCFNRCLLDMVTEPNQSFADDLLRALWEAKHDHWHSLTALMDDEDPAKAAREFLAFVTEAEKYERHSSEEVTEEEESATE